MALPFALLVAAIALSGAGARARVDAPQTACYRASEASTYR